MTKDKAQKRAIRARMAKTGERYTSARLYLLDLHHPDVVPDAGLADAAIASADEAADVLDGLATISVFPAPPAADGGTSAEDPYPDTAPEIDESSSAVPVLSPVPSLPNRVADPGMRDEAIQRATGCGWDEWFVLLDAWGGTERAHAEIARHLHDAHGIDGWWAQTVTVGYERARGMRAKHERPDGFSVNASKTVPVPIERLFAAIAAADARAGWLDGIELRLRTSRPNKSARFDVLPGETRLAAFLIDRGAKSTVQLQHERLPTADEVERWRAVWKDRLARLAATLASA